MRTFWQKINSRKFWACVAGVVAGLAMVFGLDETIITTVAGAVTAIASLVTYIVTEGKIDAAAVAKAAEAVEVAGEAVTK